MILPHGFSFVDPTVLVTDANNNHDDNEESNAQTDMTNK